MTDQKLNPAGPKRFGDARSGFFLDKSRNNPLSRLCVFAACRRPAHTTARRTRAFTLAELLVTTGVLVLLVFLGSQLLNSTATVTTLGHKLMDTDAEARQLLDRMAIDFAQMVKRSDVDYYVKSSAASPQRRVLQPGNDQIAFYSAVPGYYPSAGAQSPVSLVAYRVNSTSTFSSNKMERLGKGLVWNAVSNADTPVVFMPIPIASPIPAAELPNPAPNPLPAPAWPQAANMTTDASYELVGPQVFRFEYYYLLKNGNFSDNPIISPHTSVSGMQDVSAIVVEIAVIDPKSRLLLDNSAQKPPPSDNITLLRGQLIDWGNTGCAGCPSQTQWQTTPGLLGAQWRAQLDSVIASGGIGLASLPLPALAGIRLYERFIYLSSPTL